MRWNARLWQSVIGAVLLLARVAFAAPDAVDESQAIELRSPTVALADHYDVSPPLALLPPAPPSGVAQPVRPIPRPVSPAVAQPDSVTEWRPPVPFIPSFGVNFDGVGQGFSGPNGTFSVNSAPPDTNGDVGPNHYVQIVNSAFAVFSKSGTAVYGPVPTNTLWSGFGGGCQTNNDGDAVALYDPIADRWIISQFSVSSTPFLQCVAVSSTSDPTGPYNRYSFSYSNFNDYPKIGVWPDAYYITFNMFNAAGTIFYGAKVCAYDRARMVAGLSATQQCFDTSNAYGGLLPADLDGAQQPPAGAPNYVVGLGASANQLATWKFHVDWVTPANTTFTGPTTLATTAFSEACGGGTCIPQVGTSQQLDSLADRLMHRLAYRNFGDHESLVVNHSVAAGGGTGVRWYELRVAGSTVSIYQQGTYAPDSNYRWMGSIAMDRDGNMGLGFSLSGGSIHPQIHYTGRLATDPLGTMPQGEGSFINGAGSQTTNLSRWGDYSAMAVDPSDDCTFWYTTEYIPVNGTFNWRTRIASFKFPGCGGAAPNDFSIGATPPSATTSQGGSVMYTVNTAVTNGSAQTVSLSASGLPAGATATFVPPSITAGSSSTLTVNVDAATPPGQSTITITGTGTSVTHTTTVSLGVTSQGGGSGIVNGDFETGDLFGWTTSGAGGISGAAHSGGFAALVGSASATSGDSSISQTFTVPASGNPMLSFWYNVFCPDTLTYDWATVTLQDNTTNTPITLLPPTCKNNNQWLNVTYDLSGILGHNVTLFLTSHDDNYPSDPTYTLYDDVQVVLMQSLFNGGFETGDLSGWTPAGTTSVGGAAHGGSFAAVAGSSNPTNGDSSIAQTFAVPSLVNPRLSFWYNVHCPDTVAYDWATATLRDDTTSTTTTVLAHTCTNTGNWVNVIADLSGNIGHGMTLTLISHDDNFAAPPDPTYVQYDDVAIISDPPPPPPGPSDTPTTTPTATPTATDTQVGAVTSTPTNTPTVTPTYTCTATPTVSRTATPTVTSSITPTPTATPEDTGFVPPDANTLQCEKQVAKNLLKLTKCIGSCHVTAAQNAFNAVSFDEEGCEDTCRATYNASSGAIIATGTCPACLDASTQKSLADQAEATLDNGNGALFCAGSTPFGGDDLGFVPPDGGTLSCEKTVAGSVRKFRACIARCHIKAAKAAFNHTSFDEEGCENTNPVTSCRAVYDAAAATVLAGGACPPCLDAAQQASLADQINASLDADNGALFCFGSTPLP